jgi:hypothetical protein
MKLYQPKQLGVKVVDGFGNVVYKQNEMHRRIFDGVFAENILIQGLAPTGKWKIQAFKIDDAKKTLLGEDEIEIFDEALSDIKVYANVTESTESYIEVEVHAKHSFGQQARGKFAVTAWIDDNQLREFATYKAEVGDAAALIRFKLKEDLKLITDKALVSIEVRFEEALTGLQVLKTLQTEVCSKNCYKIDIIAEKLKAGLPFSFQVNVDKTGERDISEPIKATVQFISICEKLFEITRQAEIKNNQVKFTVDVLQNVTEVIIEAHYRTASKLSSFKALTSKSGKYLKLSLLTEK